MKQSWIVTVTIFLLKLMATSCLLLIASKLVHCNIEGDKFGSFDASFGPEKSLRVGLNESILSSTASIDYDENGYVMYCPCMGRFGNQAEQFIGALAFAKGLNRTLVVPPWITYPSNRPFTSLKIEFRRWFQIDPLKEFHRVITMEDFMANLAPDIWPPGKRMGFCYTFRGGDKCAMKDGNPFGPFWDHFNINFDGYVEHTGLLWNSHEPRVQKGWKTRYPFSKYLIYAFQGAPGNFPSSEENQQLQKYIKFSKLIHEKSSDFIENTMKGVPYVAVHLRNGGDMKSLCDDVKTQKLQQFFASVQCTGYNLERQLTYDMCNPSKKEIINKVKKYVKKVNAKALFVGTDNNAMLDDFRKALEKLKVSVYRRPAADESDDPIVDIYIMSEADYFIGNCVSTFSAFVRRQRDAAGKPLAYFGLD